MQHEGASVSRNTRVAIAGLIVFFAGAGSQSFAQRAYEEFRPPWYAEAVRLGDAYTGVARGLAAMQHNPAGRIGNRTLLRVMVAADASLNRWYDDYSLLRYAGAVETTVAEILMLSAGFEDHTWLDNSWEAEAIFRWGVGLRYPVGELLRLRQHIDLQIDYARSDFPLGDEFTRGADGYVDPVVWSVSLRWVP